MDAELFGKNVLVLRKKRGLSQQELANLAEVSRNYISMIERGEAKNVSEEIIRRLAGSLEVSEGELKGEPGEAKELSIPSPLRKFALNRGLNYKTVDKLRQIPFRGKEPETAEEWENLYEAVKEFISE